VRTNLRAEDDRSRDQAFGAGRIPWLKMLLLRVLQRPDYPAGLARDYAGQARARDLIARVEFRHALPPVRPAATRRVESPSNYQVNVMPALNELSTCFSPSHHSASERK
jgi:hypothetical protein